MNEYKIEKMIGKGSYGEVYSARKKVIIGCIQ